MSNNNFTSPDLFSIAKEILKNRPLDPDGIHGITHWGRVLENGERLAAMTGANLHGTSSGQVFTVDIGYLSC